MVLDVMRERLNLRALQILLQPMKIGCTVRYLAGDVVDALELAERAKF